MIPIAKPIIESEELENVKSVLSSGQLAQGKWVNDFEQQFANYIGVKYAVALCNGTVALDLALKAIRIKQGDEVIVPAFTFIATANAVLFQGAKPIFADVNEKTFNLDPESVKEKITKKTRTIIPVHLFGQPADMRALMQIADDHKMYVVEDCAQAHGAKYDGRRVGGFGLGTFSFYATKNITTGEGGMVTTNDEQVAKKLKLLRDHGQSEKYLHTELGYNYRMTNIAAAIGIAQLAKLEKWDEKRRKNAEYLNEHLGGVKGIVTPYVAANTEHVYHQYVIKVEREFGKTREQLKDELAKRGIGSALHYPLAVHQQPLYKNLGYKTNCTVSERLANKVLSLPVHPGLSTEQLEQIPKTIEEISR
ncbi:MAG TPA: DegT/DnrJ/EryC1/StrS family aminotransferase [Candidatus Bilamarchaeaceae archaeon]|nr:DegT/DnrJ/EryC1/StrS family aminotransferase [Candidatus Bilamarchaeaceae archaeon]